MNKDLLLLMIMTILTSCGSVATINNENNSLDMSNNEYNNYNDNSINEYNNYNDNSINVIKTNDYKSSSHYSIPTISEVDKNIFLNAINRARAEARDCGDGRGVLPAVNPLVWNDELYKASYEHNYDMLNANYFAHQGSNTQYDITGRKINQKSNPIDRLRNNGYLDQGITIGYGSAENLAEGQATIENAVLAWLNSEHHCINIMNGNFTEMGLSKVLKPNYGYLWTNVFGYKK